MTGGRVKGSEFLSEIGKGGECAAGNNRRGTRRGPAEHDIHETCISIDSELGRYS